MNKKKIIFILLVCVGIIVLTSQVNAASLPRIFGLPDNTDLRRGDLISYVGVLIRAALGLIGAILLVIIVYAGFTYATSLGEDKRITRAKNTLTYAVVGIVVIAGAFILADYIIENILR